MVCPIGFADSSLRLGNKPRRGDLRIAQDVVLGDFGVQFESGTGRLKDTKSANIREYAKSVQPSLTGLDG
jgi:hypothetical protein